MIKEKIKIPSGPKAVITHTDGDGVVSLALFLKASVETHGPSEYQNIRVFFSSQKFLISSISEAIYIFSLRAMPMKSAFVFDITAKPQAFHLLRVFDSSYWIDHHIWECDVPEDLFIYVNPSAPSAASLVADILGISDELVQYANEIDLNEIRSEEARKLRDLIAILRQKPAFRIELYTLARKLALEGIAALDIARYKNMLADFYEYLSDVKQTILESTRTFDYNKKRIAIVRESPKVPVYWISEILLEHPMNPFDIIAVTYRNGIRTHIEFRTQTDYPVINIAVRLGGNGHKYASGATVKRAITVNWLLEKIKEAILCEKHKI